MTTKYQQYKTYEKIYIQKKWTSEIFYLKYAFRTSDNLYTNWNKKKNKKKTHLKKNGHFHIEINNGEKFFAPAHRNNNLAIVLSYELNKKLDISANWVYNNGAPITTPTGRFEYGGQINPVYANRNDAKMPDYHRLDIGVDWKLGKKRETKKFNHSLNFSIYNVYNRKNAYTINFVQDKKSGTAVAQKTYLFGILPSITWNFTWK